MQNLLQFKLDPHFEVVQSLISYGLGTRYKIVIIMIYVHVPLRKAWVNSSMKLLCYVSIEHGRIENTAHNLVVSMIIHHVKYKAKHLPHQSGMIRENKYYTAQMWTQNTFKWGL